MAPPGCAAAQARTASGAPLRSARPSAKSTPLIRRVGTERDDDRVGGQSVAGGSVDPPRRCSQRDDRAPFGSLVGERGKVGRAICRARVDAGPRDDLAGLTVAERNRAGLVEQQRVDVTGRFDRRARRSSRRTLRWSTRSIPAIPMRRKQTPMVVGIRHTSSAISTTNARHGAGVEGERRQGRDRDQEEMMVSPASKIESAISFGVFCRWAPSTSEIMRSRNDSPGLALTRTRCDRTARAYRR